MTKLSKILTDRQMSQRDLQRAILDKHKVLLGDDRISRMVTGIHTNYQVKFAKMIADTLNVKVDDIIE